MKVSSQPTSIQHCTGGSSQGNEIRKKEKLSTPKYENICSHKNLYTDVHSNIIYISQKVETTQIDIIICIDK